MEELDCFDQEPLSPEVVVQGSPNSLGSSENHEGFDVDGYNSDSSTTSDIVETPKRPVTKKRKRCRELNSDEDSSTEKKGLNESIGEIKTLVKMLCKKVDKNERCLRELQQIQAR